MSNRRPPDSSARGDAEIVIAPDGRVMIFDLDAGLLPLAEAVTPGDPRLRTARAALDASRKRSSD